MVKFSRALIELHINGMSYDVSQCVDNWSDVAVILERKDLSGVFKEITVSFQFVAQAYDLLLNTFKQTKWESEAMLYIYIRLDSFSYSTTPDIYELDFTSYKKTDTHIEINTKSRALVDLLKTKERLTYDISVNSIKEVTQWNFGRITLNNIIGFRTAGTITENIRDVAYVLNRTVGTSYETTDVAVKDIIYENVVASNIIYNMNDWHTQNDVQFAELNEAYPGNLLVRITTNISFTVTKAINFPLQVSLIVTSKYDINDPKYQAYGSWDSGVILDHRSITYTWNGSFYANMKPGDRLYLIARINASGSPLSAYDLILDFDGTMNLEYVGSYLPVIIPVVEPRILLQKLVDTITDTIGLYTTDILNFNTDQQNLIKMVAAESIRNFDDPYIHTSYADFVLWMNTFGYEPDITKDSVIFKPRAIVFDTTNILNLTELETADLIETVDTERLYSGIKIGYEIPEYNNSNGRYEFNGLYNYATDSTKYPNILELISPYRADGYGIEFLAQYRIDKTQDKKSDKDLFLVNVKRDVTYYETILVNITGNVPNQTVFNARLNPYFLVKKNLILLGFSSNIIKFVGSVQNSQISIEGNIVRSDITIPDTAKVMDAIIYEIATGTIQKLPELNKNGLVQLKYKGEVLEGFIQEISKNILWESEVSWKLIKRRS